MAVVLLPNSDLVAVAWLQTIRGITADVIAAQLPKRAEWKMNGAIIATVAGGSPDPDLPIAKPVVQLDFYAVNPASDRLPWFRASSLAEQVRGAVYDKPSWGRPLAITAGGVVYPPARVIGARIMTEPRRIWGDGADYARIQMDVRLTWVSFLPAPSI